MIETVDNTIQLLVTGICTVIAFYRAMREQERAWVFLGLFTGIFFMGTLYWLLYLIFFQTTPEFTGISELSWYTSYLFLMLLNIYVRLNFFGHKMPPAKPGISSMRLMSREIPPILWLVPVFTIGMCIFYMQWGSYFSNILSAFLMTGLLWHAVSVLLSRQPVPKNGRMLYIVTLLFCLAEYGLWTSSCFWMGDTLANVYFWFDFLLSATFILFLPALRKAVVR